MLFNIYSCQRWPLVFSSSLRFGQQIYLRPFKFVTELLLDVDAVFIVGLALALRERRAGNFVQVFFKF